MSLQKVRNVLLENIQKSYRPSKPKYDAFEIEDTIDHSNMVFALEGNSVAIYNNHGVQQCRRSENFPFGTTTAQEYYEHLFNKSLRIIDGVCFFRYVKVIGEGETVRFESINS